MGGCSGRMSLINAIRNGDMFAVSDNIRSGADVNRANENGDTPMNVAITKGDLQCLEMLIQAGADVNKYNSKAQDAPIFSAARSGNIECLRRLINAGADVNKRDPFGYPVLSKAIEYGNTDCAALLVKMGADVNARTKNPYTPAMWATDCGNDTLLKLLIEKGADVNVSELATSSYLKNSTPLFKACHKGYEKCVKVLVKAGANVNQLTPSGLPLLMYAADRGSENAPIVQLLIQGGARVNQIDHYGCTALLRCAMKGYAQCVNVLIESGANVNMASLNAGYTPLMFAAKNGLDMQQLLIAGAAVNILDNYGNTALYYAVSMGQTKCVNLLVNSGAVVNSVNFKKHTILHMALQSGVVSCIKLVLKSGANVNVEIQPNVKIDQTLKNNDTIAAYMFAAGDRTWEKTPNFLNDILSTSTIRLDHLCRVVIRDFLTDVNPHGNFFTRIPKLGLPTPLAQYVLYNVGVNTKPGNTSNGKFSKSMHNWQEISV